MNKIDLSKNQLVEGDVKVWYWDDDKENAEIGYLAIINHKSKDFPFLVWEEGLTGEENDYNYEVKITSYKNVEMTELKYRVKDFYSLSKVLKEEGYKQSTKKKDFLYSHSVMKYCEINWKFIFSKCGEVLTREEAEEHFSRTWLEEVGEDE